MGAARARRAALRPWQALLAAAVGGTAAQAAGLAAVVVAAIVAAATTGARTALELTPIIQGPAVFALSVLAVGGILLLTALVAPLAARVPLRGAWTGL